MDKKRMKRMIGIAIPRALIITSISYNGYIRTHTFTLFLIFYYLFCLEQHYLRLLIFSYQHKDKFQR